MNKTYTNNNIIDTSSFQVGLNHSFSSTGCYLRANLSKEIIKCKKKKNYVFNFQFIHSNWTFFNIAVCLLDQCLSNQFSMHFQIYDFDEAFFLLATIDPVDTGRTLNVHKAFRRCPGRLLNILCTFNLCPVSMGKVFISCFLCSHC